MPRTLPVVFALFLPVSLAAQAPVRPAPRDGIMAAYEFFASHYGSNLAAAFDSIPASQYDFHPRPMQQSVGYIAQHVTTANYAQCSQLGGLPLPAGARDSLSDSARAHLSKDTLVAHFRASLRFCDTALARVPKLQTAAQAHTLLALETDLAEHYSQVSGYMRLLGLVPPTALPPRARTAIELPAAALAPYVGTYQLDDTRQLEVALRDGGLVGTSTGGRTLRMWPETPQDFFFREVNAQVTFTRDASGAVTGLVVHQEGRDTFAPRVR